MPGEVTSSGRSLSCSNPRGRFRRGRRGAVEAFGGRPDDEPSLRVSAVDALDVLVERGLHAALHRGGCRTAKLVSEAKQDNSPNLGRPRSSPIAGRLLLCASDSASCWRSPGANSGPLSSWTTSKRVTLRVANARSRRAKRWPALAQARRVDVVRGASEICAALASARAVNGEAISSLPHVGNALARGECDSEGLDPGVPRAAWARSGLDPGTSRGGGVECPGRATGCRNQRCVR